MEILVLIAVIAVGASALYVALTFNIRIEKRIDPLMRDTKQDILDKIEEVGGALEQKIQKITTDLREAASGELEEQIKPIRDKLRQDGKLIAGLTGKIDTWQDQLGPDELKKIWRSWLSGLRSLANLLTAKAPSFQRLMAKS